MSDTVTKDSAYHYFAPAIDSNGAPASVDSFALANGEIEGRRTGDRLASGAHFVVYATTNAQTEWHIDFPIGARNIRIEKVALMGAGTGDLTVRGTLENYSDDPKDGRDVQLPRFGVSGYRPSKAADPTLLSAAPGFTFQEFLAFQVLFVPEECIPPVVTAQTTVTVAPDPLTLICSPDPVVPGGTVTCEVTNGPEDFEVLWHVMFDGVFDAQGLMLDADGRGTFTFVAPRASAGQTVSVVIVDWTSPIEVGVTVDGLVPSSVPAGEGGVPFGAVLFALLAAAGALLAGRRLVTAG